MSRDSSEGEPLADWALVSSEGNIEAEEASSGSSSDEFVNVTHQGVVVFGRHRSPSVETDSQPKSMASLEMSALLRSSLDEIDQSGAMEDIWPLADSAREETGDPGHREGLLGASLTASAASTGDESTDIISEDEKDDKGENAEPSHDVVLPSSINISSSLSSLSQVPGLTASADTSHLSADDGAEASDDGVISLSTGSMKSSGCERMSYQHSGAEAGVEVDPDTEILEADQSPCFPMLSGFGTTDADDVASPVAGGQHSEEGAESGDEGAGGEDKEWLKYPLENSSDERCHTIRLGDGRVIVAPPGADLASLAADLDLVNKSDTSSDTSDSDFVRLDALSSCSSSNENSDTEGDEVFREELSAPSAAEMQAAATTIDVMAESVSSVSSGFRFLPQQIQPVQDVQDPPMLHPNVLHPLMQDPPIMDPHMQDPPMLDAHVLDPPVQDPPMRDAHVLDPHMQDPSMLDAHVLDPHMQDPPMLDAHVLDPHMQDPTMLDAHVLDPHMQDPPMLDAHVLDPHMQDPPMLDAHVLDPHMQDPPMLDAHVLDPHMQDPPMLDAHVLVPHMQDPPMLDPPVQDPPMVAPPVLVLPVDDPPMVVAPAAEEDDDDDDNGDGDTESVTGNSVDDRVESDQSDQNSVHQNEDEDQPFDDIGDIPLDAGNVARQYIHKPNKSLNWTLDVIVIMVVLLAIGIGIGHSIGSVREHFLQHEMNLAQESRLSVLKGDLFQCHQKKRYIEDRRQEEWEQRLWIVAKQEKTNSQLRDQLAILEKEMITKISTLEQSEEIKKDLRQTSIDLRNEVNQLQHDNAELTSRLAAMQYKTVLPDHKAKESERVIEELKTRAVLLEVENDDLKAEIQRLRNLLHASNGAHLTVSVEDDGYESMEEVTEVTTASCLTEGHGHVTDLKARINLLEQENADMRAEIGRLRYKSHPGNVHSKVQEVQDVTEDHDWIVQPTQDDISEKAPELPMSEEEIQQLRAELSWSQKQADNWQRLYLNLKETHARTTCNISINFLTCMRIFTQQLNNSINTTSIKEFLNVTKLMLSVEDVKEAFMTEFQNIWREFSGSRNPEDEGRSKEGPQNAQKKWSDSVKDILNRTQSSMSNMSQQIKETWNQVKNLSEELWKKHEPALSKVASKITERVRKFSDHVHDKIKQKTTRWFNKQKKRERNEANKNSKRWHESQDGERHGSKRGQKKRESGKWHQSQKRRGQQNLQDQVTPRKRHQETVEENGKMSKKGHKRQETNVLRHRMRKQFKQLKTMMQQMSEERHLEMTPGNLQDICDFFIRFQTDWDIYKWLERSDVQWIICQSAWWHDRLHSLIPSRNPVCKGNIYGWQFEWGPSSNRKGTFRTKQGKSEHGKKPKKKILERNLAAGQPYSYEKEKRIVEEESHNETEWYEQRARDREEMRKEWRQKRQKALDGDWYDVMMKNRWQQREAEHKSDWIFDRAADREEERSEDKYIPSQTFAEPMHHSGQPDPRTAWLFVRAEEQDYHHTEPNSWYFQRAKGRRQGKHNDYYYNDDDDDDVYDYSHDDRYGDYDPRNDL
ncbi:uncharacterized protein LOC124135747 isoform X1 [Haliotis rufescens]|uniref:uncharacterized protein LOC124135747 isoform X1 n=2 Tax=Haliotis rufescens TaxID=6454 RepID=UPI001EAFBE93|nr:uncharacterized protein LOC124135747 isoform X1 [Haliotis rufescens]XP_046357227.1 uncharacterized protein LOC124135747 isoform X1 [Haliotis rufescens]